LPLICHHRVSNKNKETGQSVSVECGLFFCSRNVCGLCGGAPGCSVCGQWGV